MFGLTGQSWCSISSWNNSAGSQPTMSQHGPDVNLSYTGHRETAMEFGMGKPA